METIFPANLLTGAKHRAFQTNHLVDIDKTKHNYARKLTITAVCNVTEEYVGTCWEASRFVTFGKVYREVCDEGLNVVIPTTV